jgi:hypothetical protein
VLDIGAGSGTWGAAIATATGGTSLAIDLPDVVRANEGGTPPNTKIVAFDFTADTPRSEWRERFDAVVLANVLHLFDRSVAARILRLATYAAKPDGRIIVVDPLSDLSACGALKDRRFAAQVVVRTSGGFVRTWPGLMDEAASVGLIPGGAPVGFHATSDHVAVAAAIFRRRGA